MFNKKNPPPAPGEPLIAFWNKDKLHTKMVELSKDSDFQRVLKTRGFTDIDAYTDIATVDPIKVTYNKTKDEVSFDATYKLRQPNGTWKVKHIPIQSTTLSGSEEQYKTIISELEVLKARNLSTMDVERTANKKS
jgi:hypothetical protein